MARSSPRGRRPAARPAPPEASRESHEGVGPPPGPSLASATIPRVWQGVGYRPLPAADAARPLFDFAALPWPDPRTVAFAWGAFTAGDGGERLIGALVGEAAERAMMLHGPVVIDAVNPLEVAAQLVAASLDHATALGADTVFGRPQGLDRIWVRSGFVPVPESTLPGALAGRPGAGLYAWRGGSALFTLRESPAS